MKNKKRGKTLSKHNEHAITKKATTCKEKTITMNNDYLIRLAEKYNTEDFIKDDPVSFPHRFKEKKDIEISAFIAQWIAYGKRELFLKVLDDLYQEMDNPYLYLKNRDFNTYKNNSSNLYRFYTYNDFYVLCDELYNIYFTLGQGKKDMEEVIKDLLVKEKSPIDTENVLLAIIHLFPFSKGIPKNLSSACKRLCMFLRWMVRNDGIVDFGIWNVLKPNDLIIPVDTHVYQEALNLNLTKRKTADFKTAIEITNNLKKVFPDDVCLGDFALFGYGVNKNL